MKYIFSLFHFYLAELGDYNTDEHKGDYLSEFRFIPSQTAEFERQVIEYHKQHR